MNHTDYYVYAHRDLNGVVFYIGKGCNKRAYEKYDRSKSWNIAAKEGFNVEFIFNGLSEQEAFEKESQLLNNPLPDWKLVNKLKDHRHKKIDIDFLRSYLYYDPSSPTFLRCKSDIYAGKRTIRKYANDEIGSFSKDGYVIVSINAKHYKAHRIVYMLFNGEIPENMVINHKDGNTYNNCIDNLEACYQKDNVRRSKVYQGKIKSGNNSGVTGVYQSSHDPRYISWIAAWRENGKKMKKHFYVHKHGEAEAFRLACEYRKQMIEKLNSEGAGYSITE